MKSEATEDSASLLSSGNSGKKISRFDDGYEYDSIYKEADHMLSASNLIYTLANMRDLEWKQHRLAKAGNFILVNFDDPSYMRPEIDPKTKRFKESLKIAEIAEYVSRNLKEMKKDKEFYDANQGALEMLSMLKTKSTREVVYIDDSEGDENEIVYGLSVDHSKKRVIVCFRGTTCRADVFADIKIRLTGAALPNCDSQVKLHRGFFDYLFSKDRYQERSHEAEDICKFRSIMVHIRDLLKANKGYKLYVSGHSLGAALASLFALCASKSDQISTPVTCVSVASPYVGDKNWRRAVMEAEKAGLLRYLRVANATDVVAHGPPFDLRLRLYKHVGINLRLENDGWFVRKPYAKFQYPGGRVAEFAHAFQNTFLFNCGCLPSRVLKMHSCPEYARRLHASKDELHGLYLNDLYEEYFKSSNKIPYTFQSAGFAAFIILVVVAAVYFADIV
eukprot:CAMPEP_0195517456 /NCGR_PEP_ID=MMETSP0794_2-20130614/10886_1 /TAXON_ID=515487 /ORGANISM="Stephanopyxis turris, Strain CCMP 815" /LENGTH=447 /DNA_ID=CAMNT_0040646269 /DNA_START=21 /DNA_END=1364 /DNA_ORIENTATION=+